MRTFLCPFVLISTLALQSSGGAETLNHCATPWRLDSTLRKENSRLFTEPEVLKLCSSQQLEGFDEWLEVVREETSLISLERDRLDDAECGTALEQLHTERLEFLCRWLELDACRLVVRVHRDIT